MKTLALLFVLVITGTFLQAQDQGAIPKISLQITNYFSYYPSVKIYLITDKTTYKPGETIKFHAFITDAENHLASEDGSKLSLGLYDKTGTVLLKDAFPITKGEASGNLMIADNLNADNYFLAATTTNQYAPDQTTIAKLRIDPLYSNQWVLSSMVKDSISVSGKQNELYISLNDISGTVLKNEFLRFKLKNGSEVVENGKLKTDDNGKFTIPFTVPAKTNGEPFVCEISDAKDEWKQEIFLPTGIDPVVVKFYPEGGTLVSGVPTRVGFTVFNKWGVPVDVEGSVVNADGSAVTPVKTLTKGLGIFTINNSGQQKMKLVLSGSTGTNQSFELPAPAADGLSLSLTKADQEFVYTNMVFADKQKHTISLIITHGNSVYWAGDMEINGSGRLKLPATELPQGVNLLSVFSKEGNLLAERLFYKDNKQLLKVNIQPEKTSLTQKSKMQVKVLLADENDKPVAGNVNIAVVDKTTLNKVPLQIDEYLQIDSELETPISSFPEAFNIETINPGMLDILLVSNRLKAFDWAKIRQFKPESAADSHFDNFRISGVVTDKGGNKINKAKVSLANNKNMQIYSAITNADGTFSIPNLSMGNIDDYSVKATDADGKRDLKVTFIKDLPGQISAYITDHIQKCTLMTTNNYPGKAYVANNPDLFTKAPKKARVITNPYESQQKLLASATSILEVIKTLKPYKLSGDQIVFVGSENSLNYQGGALIVIDGQMMGTSASILQGISPSNIDHINVSTNPMDIQRYTGLNSVGIIEVFQKGASRVTEKTIKKPGFIEENEAEETKAVIKRDLGTTLFWKTDQRVDQSGAFTFEIEAGKVISDFVIDVQATTTDGRSGAAKTKITVTK